MAAKRWKTPPAKRGKPQAVGSASGRHDYSGEQSLSYWQARWRLEFESLPAKVRHERAAHTRRLLRDAPSAPLRQYAAACGISEDGDGDDGICDRVGPDADLPDDEPGVHA